MRREKNTHYIDTPAPFDIAPLPSATPTCPQSCEATEVLRTLASRTCLVQAQCLPLHNQVCCIVGRPSSRILWGPAAFALGGKAHALRLDDNLLSSHKPLCMRDRPPFLSFGHSYMGVLTLWANGQSNMTETQPATRNDTHCPCTLCVRMQSPSCPHRELLRPASRPATAC